MMELSSLTTLDLSWVEFEDGPAVARIFSGARRLKKVKMKSTQACDLTLTLTLTQPDHN
jgi:hypothetical protein